MKITDCSKTALIMMRVWLDDFACWSSDISNDYFAPDIRGRIAGDNTYIVCSVDDAISIAREWEAKKPAERIVEIYFLDGHYENDSIIWY